MEHANAYIPIDRRQALIHGDELPQQMSGAALFADISGFTPLTAALDRALGSRRGAEVLTAHLNRVYDALVAAVHRFGGSVVGFAGDAVTCWFDGDDARRAVACGLAMQSAMRQFAALPTGAGQVVALGIKATVAAGPVRRFLVGIPDYVVVDVMAGLTLEKLAAADRQARRGEVILDAAAAANLAPWLTIAEWRRGDDGDQFAVISGLDLAIEPTPWPSFSDDQLTEAQRAAWLLPPIRRRLARGQGTFLAELRPAAALFLRFGGINYDAGAAAPEQLATFVEGVSRILMRLDGSLIQLTVGDKGSYLYAAFGAPIAHEDDARRAGTAALDIQDLAASLPFLESLQMGIAVGRMRTGAYGATTRRTYGVLGDSVNLAARLMSAARPGQILVSAPARNGMGDAFVWEEMDALSIRGKSMPEVCFRLLRRRRQARPRTGRTAFPLIGRSAELAQVAERLGMALAGRGQIVGITADAGLGKSRLAAEIGRRAQKRGVAIHVGACSSYGTAASYLVWQGVWRSLLDLNAADSAVQQIAAAEAALRELDPSLVARLPLLQAVLNLPIAENDLTASLDARTRRAALESLLVTALELCARRRPLLILLEDTHWIDPLSAELLTAVGRAVATLPVLLLLLYRPPERAQRGNSLAQLPHFTEIPLQDFTPAEAEQLIAYKLRRFYGGDRPVAPGLVTAIAEKGEGNPFFMEEIVNYLTGRGIAPDDPDALAGVDLPTSIYSLILSRVDQLTARQQTILRVASVIGRLFPLSMVWGVHPEPDEIDAVRADLVQLSNLELTQLDSPEPEPTYLFKHVLTQEIVYGSLLYETRAALHDQIGQFIEAAFADELDRHLAQLAFHFERSENEPKKRRYLRRAGEAAQADFANALAVDFYLKLLPLLPPAEQAEVHFRIGQVYDTIGRWAAAESAYREAMSLAAAHGQQVLLLRSRLEIGDMYRKRSNYDEALRWFAAVQADAAAAGDGDTVGRALHYSAGVHFFQGNLAVARKTYESALSIRRELGDLRSVAKGLINLGAVARSLGDVESAIAYQEEAVAILRDLRDRWPLATALNNLGNAFLDSGSVVGARRSLEEAVALQREIGHRWFLGNALNNLANVARAQRDFAAARDLYAESIIIYRELNDRWALAYLLEDRGVMAAMAADGPWGLRLIGAAARLREEIGAPLSAVEAEKLGQRLAAVRAFLGERAAAREADGRRLSLDEALDEALRRRGGPAEAAQRG